MSASPATEPETRLSEWPQRPARTHRASKAGKADSRRPTCLAEATHQEQWTRELAAWKAVAGEHDRMMHSWRKAWVCGWAQGGQGLAGWVLLGPHVCALGPQSLCFL